MPKDKELEQAKFHLKKNNSEIAISILLQTIALKKAKSAHFEILGYVYGNLGDKKKCLHYLSMACEFSNATPEAHFYLGKELIQMDEYQSGIQHLHKSLSKAGNFFEALFELGIGYQKLKKFSESLDFFKKSIEINRDSVHALINIGKLYSEEFNDPQNGVKFFDQAITLNPNNYDAWIAKGVAYNLLEDNEQAVLCFLKATQINPELAIAWNNYGLVLMRLKKINEAIIAFTHAMRCEPSNVIFIINTANLYLQLKNYSIAIDLFLLTLRLDQNCAEAWIGRARCEFKTKKLSEAFISIDKAIQCDPNLSDGLFYKGCFYADLKKYKLAIQFFELALKANNSQSSLLGYLLEAKMSILDWGGIDKLFTDLSFKIMNGKASSNPLIFQAISNDPDQNLKCGEAFCSATFIRFSDYKITNEVKNKLRIAYISPDFKKHPVGHLTHEIYKFHDRSRFEVYGYFLDSYSDSLTDVISNNFDKKFDCWHLSDLQLVDLIRSHSIDIAVDLAGHTQNSRLNIFLNRIAPIQINFIGYPGTMGCAQFDYIIGDPILIPKSNKEHYSEKIITLPRIFQPNSARYPSKRFEKRSDVGLPDNKFIFCCFNSNYKISNEIFYAWLKILKSTKNSMLWLYASSDDVKENIYSYLRENSLDTNRVIFAEFLSYQDHLSRFKFADLFLDTKPFNAGTTCSDALYSRVPVLTIKGQHYCGRMSESLLSYLDLQELISDSVQSYTDKAIELCNDRNLYISLKAKLNNAIECTDLFDIDKFVNDLETAYLSVSNQIS